MENIYLKSLTLYTELGLTPANQANNTVDKLGPVPSETPSQNLFVFFFFCKITFVLYTVSSYQTKHKHRKLCAKLINNLLDLLFNFAYMQSFRLLFLLLFQL